MKRIFKIVLSTFIIFTSLSIYRINAEGFEGSGLAEDPYLIKTNDDLVLMSALVDGSEDYAKATYQLTADIDMKDIDFSPIGTARTFKGVLDGNGHVITNLTITSSKEHVGLVGFLEQGTIKNLGIESGTIQGQGRVGALVGRTMYATILNCFSKANVSGTNDVGGLVGMFNNSTMNNCYVWGNINGSGVTIGGIVGGANRSIDPSTPTIIKNCYSMATVTGGQFVGSALGYDESTAGEMYAITAEHLYYDAATVGVGNNDGRSGVNGIGVEKFLNGQLLETLNNNVESGYNPWVKGATGYPEFNDGMSECGLIGQGTKDVPYLIRSSGDLSLMSQIINGDAAYEDDYYQLTADLDMSGISFTPIDHFTGVLDGKNHFISNLNISVTNRPNTGLIGLLENGTIKNIGIESGTIIGTDKTGALVGRTMYATIINCYSKANVEGSNDVGGLVGMFNNSTMNNCYVWGNVNGSGVTVGGLVGGANRSIDPATPTIIQNCYSKATVSGLQHVGNIMGYDESTAAEIYHVTMNNLYYQQGQSAIGNNNDRDGLKAVSLEAFTNGELIEKLNANLNDGYTTWLEDNAGYPGFRGKVFIKTSLIGKGTAEEPYLIKTTEDLKEMERVVNLSAEFASAHYQLKNNLDLKEIEFNGLSSVISFKGVFDGDGHVVKNINIKVAGGQTVGFFHQVEGGTIKNFGIDSGKIEAGLKVGSLIGKSFHATILNCYNNASVKGFEDIGGLVGMLNNSDILNSYNKGIVSGSKSLGGLAGSVCRSFDPSYETNLVNSYNLGRVHWGTYSGKVAGYIEQDSYLANYQNIYYNQENLPNIAIGNFIEVTGITAMKKDALMASTFVDTLNKNKKDGYSDWTLGTDQIVRLAIFDDANELEKFTASIKDEPEIKNDQLVLPKSNDNHYQAVLYGSTNQQVVSLDGHVYTPLTKQTVYLIYNIIDLQSGEVVSQLDRNIKVTVKGKYGDTGTNKVPNVVPGLREWYGLEGNFKLTSNTHIVYEDAQAKKAAEKLKMYLSEMVNLNIEVKQGGAISGDIVIKYTPDKLNELGNEGYYINIGDQVVISAPTNTGMLYGAVSIAQILYQDKKHNTIPMGIIRDYPQDSVRGGMLDVARRYFDLNYVEDMGKYMAWFKMNTFHLHINEDSGLGGEYSSSFVVESKKYPALNTYNKQAGDYVWSQDDYRQMQKNLKQFGIDVITEIDSPGHATIFNLIDPSIVNGSNFDLTNHYDESLALISSVFDEFLDGDDPVFQNASVHIGTDESSNTNENMRRYINDLAQYCLSKDNIDEVYFWGNLSVYYGATQIDAKNVVNQIWDSADQRVEQALADGFKVVNSTSNSMYIIPGNGNGLHNGYVDTATFYDTWKGSNDFNTHRATNPTWIASRNYYAEYDLLRGNPQVIGTLFCNWNDRSWANDFDILDLVLPYIGVISEKTWYGDEARFDSGNNFVKAFNQVDDYAPDSNPRRFVATDSNIIAKYDFEKVNNQKVPDLENNYDATLNNATLTAMDSNYLNGKVVQLTNQSSLSLPFSGVGYPYTVNFDLYLDGEQSQDAILFKDDQCTFYLNYQDHGVSFTLGKYTYTYDFALPLNEWINITLTSNYIHGSSATTILKVDGASYLPTLIAGPSSVPSHSMSSYLPTSQMFINLKGSLDNLAIGNKYNQNISSLPDYEFKGEGTKENPYLIESEKELILFANEINCGEKTQAYFKLTSDLDMQDYKYIPAANFSGDFNGNGHTITNLTINQPQSENVGLIGLLENGTVRNLNMRNANMTGKARVGALVGRTMYATIINCSAQSNVTGGNDVGGLVGMFNNSTMKNCYSWSKITGTVETAGGLVGAANRSINPAIPTSLDNCYSITEVSAPKYGGVIAGYDESIAGPTYTINYQNMYFDSSKTGFGNNTSDSLNAIDIQDFTNGSLLNKLNDGCLDGYIAWVSDENGYPVFKEIIDTNKLELSIALEMANEVTQTQLDKVVPIVATEFKAARANAQTVFDNKKATQTQINNAFDRLAKVMHMLEFYKGDKELLQSLVDKIAALKADDYIESTWKPLQAVLVEVDAVLNDENAMQAEVDEVHTKLVKAFVNLRLKPNKDLLKELINKANSLAATDYTAASWQIMQAALEQAKDVFANPEATVGEINKANKSLSTALVGLELNVPASEKPGNDSNPGKPNAENDKTDGKETAKKTGDDEIIIIPVVLMMLSASAYYISKKKEDRS